MRALDQLAGQLASRLRALDRDTGTLLRGWVQPVRHNVDGFALRESTAKRCRLTIVHRFPTSRRSSWLPRCQLVLPAEALHAREREN